MSQALTDEQIAERIRTQLGQAAAVDDLLVKGDLLQLHVSEDFYRRLAVDRDRSRKIVLMLMQQMKSLTGSSGRHRESVQSKRKDDRRQSQGVRGR